MHMKYLVLAGALLFPSLALAQSGNVNTAEIDSSVGSVTPVVCVPATGASVTAIVNGSSVSNYQVSAKKALTIWNMNASNTVYWSYATPTASANVAGSYPIPPNTGVTWYPGSAPSAAINCLSTGSSTAVSAYMGQ